MYRFTVVPAVLQPEAYKYPKSVAGMGFVEQPPPYCSSCLSFDRLCMGDLIAGDFVFEKSSQELRSSSDGLHPSSVLATSSFLLLVMPGATSAAQDVESPNKCKPPKATS